MKKFNIVKDFTVVLPDWGKDPLPIGSFYGKVGEMSYVALPDKIHFFGKFDKKSKIEIENLVKKFGPVGEVTYCSHSSRAMRSKIINDRMIESVCPHERKVQTEYTRYTGSCYSQSAIDGKGYSLDWEYTSDGKTREDKKYGYNGLPVIDGGKITHYVKVSDTGTKRYETVETSSCDKVTFGKSFEVGQTTSGPVAFAVKRESLKSLDKTHGKTEGKKKFNVSMPTSSPKRTEKDKVYAQANSQAGAATRKASTKAVPTGGADYHDRVTRQHVIRNNNGVTIKFFDIR